MLRFCYLLLLSLLSLPFILVGQPNIIFIMADDLGYGDLGCYGQKLIKTPHIDRLAEEGVRFSQAYAGAPVCTSSRCVLMTGVHNGHSVARDNVPHYDTYLRNSDVTIAEVLKEVGYRCGGVGKWSLGDPGTEGDATNQGFDMWYGYQNQDHAHYYFPEYLDDSENPNGRQSFPANSQSRESYSHDMLTERALKFIEDSGDEPFFLYAAYTVPHFASKDEDPDGLAVPSLEPYADKPWSLAARKYASMIHRLDADVGRMVALIERLGLAEKTLIIVTSDHGPLGRGPVEELDSNGPLRGAKRSLYEGGIRVPFIVRWPGKIPLGKVSDEIITFWDMLPTFAALAGNSPPSGLDGVSVIEAFQGGSLNSPHDYLYWDYGHCRQRYDQAVRWKNWKGIRHGVGGEIQLFNLERDLGETLDVAKVHPEIVKEIEAIMEKAVIPHERYPVGELYQGDAIWKRADHW